MAVTEKFHEAVRNGNIRSVRIMMKDSLLVDRNFSDFAEMEREASRMGGLYEAHDGRSLEADKSKWNKEYMNMLMVQVVGNFSRERVNHLKEVVRHLYPAPALPSSPSTSYPQTGSYSKEHSDYQTEGIVRPRDYHRQKAEDRRKGLICGSAAVAGGAVGAACGYGAACLIGVESVALCACVGAVGGIALGLAVAGGFD